MRIMDYVWPRWEFLGRTDMRYIYKRSDHKDQCTVYFYECGERRRVVRGAWSKRKARRHPFWQSHVHPWLEGENLYAPITYPSAYLIGKARAVHGYSWIDGRWVPGEAAVARDGNVIMFTKPEPPGAA